MNWRSRIWLTEMRRENVYPGSVRKAFEQLRYIIHGFLFGYGLHSDASFLIFFLFYRIFRNLQPFYSSCPAFFSSVRQIHNFPIFGYIVFAGLFPGVPRFVGWDSLRLFLLIFYKRSFQRGLSVI